MKKFVLAFCYLVVLTGCAMGPSPEERSREIEQERDSARRQAEFQKGLPPIPN